MLSAEEQRILLKIARASLAHALAGGPALVPPQAAENSELLAPRGAFVTLTHEGRLRGCIGYVQSPLPLWKVVAENALNAATRDPRFPPVSAEELAELSIEISAISQPEPIGGAGQVEIGRDGLIIEEGRRRGLLLPQVATEWGFGPEEFLDALCEKAGLAKGSWHEPQARLFRFSAQVFGDG